VQSSSSEILATINEVLGFSDKEEHKQLPRLSRHFVTAVIIGSWCLFAGIVGYNVALLTEIPIHWKVAISAFIILLPFSFFLQALLSESATIFYNIPTTTKITLPRCGFLVVSRTINV
jgi:hypothetical protein